MRKIGWIALCFIVLGGTGPAKALSFRDISGRWCSDDGNYRFTRSRLHTVRADTGVRRNLKVYEYFFSEKSFRVVWLDERQMPTVTNYAEFDGRRMVQLPTIRSSRRELRRCS
jgi:hypothetical protein